MQTALARHGPGAWRLPLENAIVMDEYRILNADGLRYEDEFVRHKILDAIGDLYLVGHPLLAYTAYWRPPRTVRTSYAGAAGTAGSKEIRPARYQRGGFAIPLTPDGARVVADVGRITA